MLIFVLYFSTCMLEVFVVKALSLHYYGMLTLANLLYSFVHMYHKLCLCKKHATSVPSNRIIS